MPASPSTSKRSMSPGKKSQTPSQADRKKAPKKEEKPAGKDIRNFFSQPGSSSATARTAVNGTSKASGTGKQPITIDDSDEEFEAVEVKPEVSKASTSKHFASKPPAVTNKNAPLSIASSGSMSPPPAKPAGSNTSKPSTSSSSAPKAKAETAGLKARTTTPVKRKADADADAEEKKPAKRQSTGASKGRKPNYLESSDDEDEETDYRTQKSAKGKAPAKKAYTPMDVDDDDDEEDDDDLDLDDLDDEDDVPKKGKTKPKAAPKKTPTKKPPAKKDAKEKKPPGKSAKKDEEDGEKKSKPKHDWRAAAAARAAGPRAPGSKEIPEGQPGCLDGLIFVFTGELESLGRDDAIELVKRYSGKVTGAPSGKTNYIVVGENAGASKMKYIEKNQEKAINEDELLELIRSRSGGGAELNEQQIKAREKEEKKVLEQAKAMEQREKEEEKLRKRKEGALKDTGVAAKKAVPISAQLWTTKYAPTNVKEICGNKTQVERILSWLQAWDGNYRVNFKKPGKDGMGMYRAILISGPPGIGKTTSAHLMAKMAGYSPIELNASDTRSKKLVENSTNIDNASLDGFFAGKGINATTVAGVRIEAKTCLIMDEVDGMSAGDRGGVGALNTLIKKTRIPLILICNDRTLQKMKPLQSTTFNMTFRRPGPNEIRSRILSIVFKEKMKIPTNVVDELIKGANSDIRQILNMLSTFKLGKSEMDFDEGKALIQVNEKNTIMTPFAIIDKLTGPYSFSRTNKDSLNDKSELYFHDFSFVPLFMQEHYLKTNPSAINTPSMNDQEKLMKHLELVSKASDSISDGDLIDRMIHGSEQQWSLLPLHAIQSTVAPAYFIYGPTRSTGGPGWGPSFPQWLGQNSKQGKLGRQLTDIQIRMRLRVSGGRQEIREQYMPMLASKIVTPLRDRGSDAIEETISYMDEYYLGKEDWDAFVELGVGEMNGDKIMKDIPSATKSAFTRQYNKADHPIAFHKGDMFASAKRKIVDQGPAPDNDEVFEEDEVAPETEDEADGKAESGEENDVSKDKLIKAVKPKGKGSAAAAAKAKKK